MALESVYLSARFERREELNGYRIELEAAGFEVTSRWITDPTPELTDDAWRQLVVPSWGDALKAIATWPEARPLCFKWSSVPMVFGRLFSSLWVLIWLRG